MDREIQLVTDGDGLAVIGDAAPLNGSWSLRGWLHRRRTSGWHG